MVEENKTISLALLGAVAVIAVVGLVLMFTTAQKTGQLIVTDQKIYDGGNREQYPYLTGRKVGTDNEKWGDEGDAWQTGVPYRTYSRAPPSIPTELTACGPYERQLGSTLARAQELRYDVNCRRTAVGFCCPIPEYATGTAKEVKFQAWGSS